jgi:hypothetical protein
MMGERVIWNLALSDILEVINLPLLWHTMHLMSSLELRQKATLVARVDCLFDHPIVKPANVQLYHTANDVTQAAIAPGGDGIMLMQDDGTLHVHKMRNLAQSRPLVVQRPDSIAGRIHEPFPTLLLSSSGKHYVAVACDHYTNTEYVVMMTMICRLLLDSTLAGDGLRFFVFFGSTSMLPLSSC